jgi:uncharacterized protein (TIGR03382 family)
VRKPAGTVVEAVIVLVGFSALAVWLTWPLATDLDGSIYGLPGDSTGTIALLWSFAEKTGYHLLGTTHMSLTGAPFGWEFPNGLNVQWALVFGPGVLATELFGEVAAYNLIVLSGLALSGPAMYLLVRRLGVAPPVAVWAGLAYTIFPWHLEKAQGHAGFVHLEGFPLLVLAVLAWYRRPTIARAAMVAGASLLLWTTAGYFGVVGSLSLGVLLLVVALFHRRRLGTRRAFGRLVLVGGFALSVPALVYAFSVAGSGSTGVGGVRSVGELFTYGARPWEYLLPSYRNPTFGDDVGNWLFGHLHGSNFSETSLYLGWLTILLALGWLAWALLRRQRLSEDEALLAVALPTVIVVAGMFSLPSPLPRTDVPSPSRVIWEVAPQFRVPSRFVVVIMTALVCLAALGLGALWRTIFRVAPGPALARLVGVGMCAAAAAVSFVELPIESSPATTDVSTTPAYYAAVNSTPPGILAEYPLATADQAVNSDYLFWQRRHGRRLLNGAQPGTFADAVGQAVVNPVSPETAESLAALGVTAVVLRPSVYAFTGGAAAPGRLGTGYRLVEPFSDGTSVWRVTAPPAPAVAVFREGFSHSEIPPRQPTTRWLVGPEGKVELFARRAGTYRARFLLTSYARPRLLRVQGRNRSRFFGVPGSTRAVDLVLRLRPGRSFVTLSARPGPQLVPDGRTVSVYVSNWQFERETRRGAEAVEPYGATED